LRAGDIVLLASDGLWGPFTDQELADGLSGSTIAQALDAQLKTAYEREHGHSDNLTGVAVRWGDGEVAHDTDEPVSDILEII
jgi:serine/threonine protein phosphatase PrpC